MSNYQKVFDEGISWDDETGLGTLVVKYETNTVESGSTGLGLRVHYDSASMTLVSQDVQSFGALVIPSQPADDSGDFDNNIDTDSFIGVNLVSLTGNWPGSTSESIATITFQKVDGGNSNFAVDYSPSSQPPLYSEFIAEPKPAVPVDTIPPAITSGSVANAIDENSDAEQVVYTASVDDPSDVTYTLAEGSDAALSINASTGEVSLAADPDFEAQSDYSFTVVATDAAGNVSTQLVSLAINNLDEAAPQITSAILVAVDENSGAGQVIYTATADDSADTSDGVTFSLAEGSDAALSIDADSGAVTLATNPDQEAQNQYNFTVVATDAAGNSSDQAVSLMVNDIDDTAPVITSGAVAAAIDENSGAGQIVYTATADDAGVTFSLAEGSDAALSIDAGTGAVTLSTDPDFEAQSEYNFR